MVEGFSFSKRVVEADLGNGVVLAFPLNFVRIRFAGFVIEDTNYCYWCTNSFYHMVIKPE